MKYTKPGQLENLGSKDRSHHRWSERNWRSHRATPRFRRRTWPHRMCQSWAKTPLKELLCPVGASHPDDHGARFGYTASILRCQTNQNWEWSLAIILKNS